LPPNRNSRDDYLAFLRIAAKPAIARRAASMTIAHSESVGMLVEVAIGGMAAGGGTAGAGPPLQAVTVLLASDTKAFRAKARPSKVALVFIVMLVSAKMFPTIAVDVPIVAELVTCHHTPQAAAPLVSAIEELLAVVSELAIWKM
jgi:hypothetical protein